MRLATWNIYWLGERTGHRIVRTEEDEALIAQVIAQLQPDVLALQEIVDPLTLERVLENACAPGFEYTIRTADGTWLTSSPTPESETNNWQKTFLCINQRTIEYVTGGTIRGAAGRKPYAVELCHRESGATFTAVAVHFQSGWPDFMGKEDADRRREQAHALAHWLRGEAAAANPLYPRPKTDRVVVLGDFNAVKDDPNHSLSPFHQAPFTDWQWNLPVSDTEPAMTAINDGYLIDFIVLSPQMAELAQTPRIYAYDLDPLLGGPTAFHAGEDGTGPLYEPPRVSDHRPVACTVND